MHKYCHRNRINLNLLASYSAFRYSYGRKRLTSKSSKDSVNHPNYKIKANEIVPKKNHSIISDRRMSDYYSNEQLNSGEWNSYENDHLDYYPPLSQYYIPAQQYYQSSPNQCCQCVYCPHCPLVYYNQPHQLIHHAPKEPVYFTPQPSYRRNWSDFCCKLLKMLFLTFVPQWSIKLEVNF